MILNRKLAALAAIALANAAHAAVINFSDQPLAPDTYNNGGPATNSNGFSSGGAYFNNTYDSTYGSWTGNSLSTVVNTGGDYPTVPDYGGNHQYASIAGGAVSGPLATYGVVYEDSYDPAYVNLPSGTKPTSIDLTNTTYDYLSMKNGDSFAKQFTSSDYFSVTLTGYSGLGETGLTTGSTTFYLAQNGSIVTAWTLVNLLPLGSAESIGYSFASSDSGSFGINTPTYVAFDDLTVVPEPAAGFMVLAGVGLLVRRRRDGVRVVASVVA